MPSSRSDVSPVTPTQGHAIDRPSQVTNGSENASVQSLSDTYRHRDEGSTATQRRLPSIEMTEGFVRKPSESAPSQQAKLQADGHDSTIRNFPEKTSASNHVPDQKRSLWRRSWKWCKTTMSDTWALEFAALILACICLTVIMVLCGVFQNKSLRHWHSYFSINTLVSVLGTVMKSCILLATAAGLGQLNWAWFDRQPNPFSDFDSHDQASRGPIGAAALLYRLRFWHLASLGCLVTILSLFSDAFIQASVEISTRTVGQENAATIPICTDLVRGGLSYGRAAAALYSGISLDGTMPMQTTLQAVCPTGNCTYSAFDSLGRLLYL
ncbi:hypothetical protein H2200_011484 [Cladophialophora chaetospira]|uniref:Uncharacterized protein n=1 Tax=Cladophialophora chaetospira TaxID=386627 RepID=A0AA38WZH6_9EURO|nr:hypothetical protein H2200_011484 [Cladophialophora chaetospira]